MSAGDKRTFWEKIKEAFNNIADLRVKDGLLAIAKVCGEGIAAAVSFAGGVELYNILKNPNLKTRQKIFPSIGYGLSIAIGVPAVVALIAGAATLLPPFLFAASVVCVVRNVGTYLEERAERNNLRKELISYKALASKIDKVNLTEDKKTAVLNSIKGQNDLYLELYALRQNIITTSQLPFEDRERLVETVNQAIEKFSRGELDNLEFDTQYIPQGMKKSLMEGSEKINAQLNQYKKDCDAVKEMNLPKSLLKAIETHKSSQENIYSQDLPLEIKNEMIAMLERKKVPKRELNDLYLRIGQHYLNNNSIDQLKIQDDSRKIRLMTYIKDEEKLNDAISFYQQPRAVYSALHALQTNIAHQDFGMEQADKEKLLAKLKEFILAFKNDPSDSKVSLNQFQDNFAYAGSPIHHVAQKVITELSKLDVVVNQYQNSPLFEERERLQKLAHPTGKEQKELAEINLLIKSIDEHQLNSLQQFSSQFGQQFRAPQIQVNHNKYDLIAKAANKVDQKTGLSAKLKKIGKSAKARSLQRLFGAANDTEIHDKAKEDENKLQKDFKERYSNTFNVMGKKERLNYLEKSVPRRLLNVGLASIVALASLATTILIPAIASPAAPAAATATVVLGAISTGLVAASALNSVDLVRKELKGNMKMAQAKKNINEGVVPGLDDDSHKRQVEYELKKQKEDAKKVVSDVMKAEPSHNILPLESSVVHAHHESMHDALLKETKEHSKLNQTEPQQSRDNDFQEEGRKSEHPR
ncbi:hypothetical protein [Candidatus Berkiella aquae]|uniref:Uncharacterized protein n=1 Tax=Candidatus Berkiella aquae TaxID=295108 RepID=A0A0Q9YQY5_9GAMM|nr:hypothetical protein [Candidatus Berkiella aquae]MCS5711631.1 hypothetical protein [Candidatus Berkiella aquae]